MRNRTQQRGFTILELMIAVAILGILASIALPSFNSAIAKTQLENAAEAIYSDIRYARSESIKRSLDVTVTFTDGANWSYTIATVEATPVTIKIVNSSQFTVTSAVSGFASDIITFGSVRGTANTGSIVVTSSIASTATITVSSLGRVKLSY